MKLLTDNRKFWRTVKPLFSDKIQTSTAITLLENNELVNDNRAVANIFNDYFVSITDSLDIPTVSENLTPTYEIRDPLDIALTKYESHPSIKLIKERVQVEHTFEFEHVSLQEVMVQLHKLNPKKSCPVGSLPTKLLKEHFDIFGVQLQNLINNSLVTGVFPDELKMGEISSLFKSEDSFIKKNYRPITVLPAVSKVYERIIQDQIIPFMEPVMSIYLCGFRKGYSTQHALMRLVEKCREFLDKNGHAGALLMDLSKAFDCLDHDLLIAKLHAYGFSRSALELIYSYLNERKQRVKVNGSFSVWKESTKGVPQGSVLGPLLFNIFINDIFFLVNDTEVCNYADDTTIFACDSDVSNVQYKLEADASLLSKWFVDNHMKLNDAKCHFMLFGSKSSSTSVNIGTSCIKQSDKEKLLGITLDKNLDFKCHVENICKKAGQKLHALARVAKFMDQEKLQTVMNAFILSQFSYCPVIWMFHDRNVNNKINKIHERALRIAFKDTSSNFEELLIKAASVTIHQKNLQLLTTEIYKTKHDLNPKFIGEIFVEKNISYSLRRNDHMSVPIPRTNAYGIETIRYTGHKLWQSLPLEIKESHTTTEFKRKIKQHHFSDCNCRLCKTYVNNLGFL